MHLLLHADINGYKSCCYKVSEPSHCCSAVQRGKLAVFAKLLQRVSGLSSTLFCSATLVAILRIANVHTSALPKALCFNKLLT